MKLLTWIDIPGWLSLPEGQELIRLAAGKVVLEFGTFKGRSACAMGSVAKHVYAVDHFEGDSHVPVDDPDALLAEAVSSAWKCGLTEKITFVVGNLWNVIPVLSPSFDLIFYDADHRHLPHRSALLRLREKLLTPSVVIAIHDYNDAWVKRVVDEFAETYGYETSVVDHLAVLAMPGVPR
jgi:predicted O-methyltransferase YrrM